MEEVYNLNGLGLPVGFTKIVNNRSIIFGNRGIASVPDACINFLVPIAPI